MNNNYKVLIGILLALVAAVLVYMLVNKDDGSVQPSPAPVQTPAPVPAPSPTSSIPSGWKTVESKAKGFMISHPDDYTASDTDVIRLISPMGDREIVAWDRCDEDPSGLNLPYTKKDTTFKGMPAQEFTYKQNGKVTWIAIQVTGARRCATIEVFAKITGQTAEDSREILNTFEFVN